jgi:curved DNA-binding protein CbpA
VDVIINSAAQGPGQATDETLRAALLDLAARCERASHFELLGVSEGASAQEVNTAYVRLLRQFHPDRMAAAGLRDIGAVAERTVARLGEAYAVLNDPKRRAEYAAQRSGKPVPPSGAALIEAETAFRKGEVFLKKADHAHAIEMLADAVRINPGEPYYRAHLAWARFDDPRARKEVLARDTLAMIDEALRDRPRFARGHFWQGHIWKYLNDMDRAERAFRQAVKVEPGFVEAEREALLLEKRRARAAEARSALPATATAVKSDGLFDRFWKRDK